MDRDGVSSRTTTIWRIITGVCLTVILSGALLLREDLWNIKVVDVAVVGGVVAALGAIFYTALAHVRETTQLRARASSPDAWSPLQGLPEKLLPVAGAGLGLILSVFIAYGALRNQSRLTAEIALNEDGGRIADWERESAAIRCLYTWFDGAPPKGDARKKAVDANADACLVRIVANRDTYTEAMLYIEESFFILRRAERDRKQWGSRYNSEIAYWQSDVSEDPTGLFAFHLLNRYPLNRCSDTPSRGCVADDAVLPTVEREMASAHVEIENLCVAAQRVHTCLHAVGRFAAPLPSGCDDKVLPDAAPRLEALDQSCRAAADAVKESQSRPPAVAPTQRSPRPLTDAVVTLPP
jgi:hypothetical protein